MKPLSFPHLLHSFFHEWLVQQRNISHHTVLSTVTAGGFSGS